MVLTGAMLVHVPCYVEKKQTANNPGDNETLKKLFKIFSKAFSKLHMSTNSEFKGICTSRPACISVRGSVI